MFGFGDGADAAHLRRTERKLDLILKHLGVDAEAALAESLSAEVRALAAQGDKIGAIKLYREQTGAGLAVAKEAVETFMVTK